MTSDFDYVVASIRKLRWYWRTLIGLSLIGACAVAAALAPSFELFAGKPKLLWFVWGLCAVFALLGATFCWEAIGISLLAGGVWWLLSTTSNWPSFWVFLPAIVVWIWHGYRLDALRDRITMLEVRLQEEKNAAFNANLLRAIHEVLAADDESREEEDYE